MHEPLSMDRLGTLCMHGEIFVNLLGLACYTYWAR